MVSQISRKFHYEQYVLHTKMAARDSSSKIRDIILETAKEKNLTERQIIDLNRRGWTMTEIKA